MKNMKTKWIHLCITGCLCLSLIGGFSLNSNETNNKNIHKKITKVKNLSLDKKIKTKTAQLKKITQPLFTYAGEKSLLSEMIFLDFFPPKHENIDQYFYGKNFYFMLLGVIKNLN